MYQLNRNISKGLFRGCFVSLDPGLGEVSSTEQLAESVWDCLAPSKPWFEAGALGLGMYFFTSSSHASWTWPCLLCRIPLAGTAEFQLVAVSQSPGDRMAVQVRECLIMGLVAVSSCSALSLPHSPKSSWQHSCQQPLLYVSFGVFSYKSHNLALGV